MARYNYLIGFGERLTEPVRGPLGGGSPTYPYTILDSQQRLIPMAESLYSEVSKLPVNAKPAGRAIAAITMHPQFGARSYFPNRILQTFNAKVVGSRRVSITPALWGRENPPSDGRGDASRLYVSVSTRAIAEWPSYMQTAEGGSLEELRRLEDIRAPRIEKKLKQGFINRSEEPDIYEVVLHAKDDHANRYIIEGFKQWCEELHAEADLERRISAGGLTFIPVTANPETIFELAQFSFLRVVRPMPQIRSVRPSITRSIPLPNPIALPDRDPVDPLDTRRSI